MADIREARSTGKELNFDGFKLKVRGLPLDFIADLADENPKFAALVDGGDIQKPALFFAIAKDARKIIATACGNPDDAKFRDEINDKLVAEQQIEAVVEILILTFPKMGGGPLGEFLKQFATLSSNP
jgi:hypothetical protein